MNGDLSILEIIQFFPEGYSEGIFEKKKYGISKQTFNAGKSFKLFAEELGGKDFISLNFYVTSQEEILKPCEMPKEKVIAFLREVKLLR